MGETGHQLTIERRGKVAFTWSCECGVRHPDDLAAFWTSQEAARAWQRHLDGDYSFTQSPFVKRTDLDQAHDRVVELERQRDAVLALHEPWHPRQDGPFGHQECCHCGKDWPCPTAAIYGGGQ